MHPSHTQQLQKRATKSRKTKIIGSPPLIHSIPIPTRSIAIEWQRRTINILFSFFILARQAKSRTLTELTFPRFVEIGSWWLIIPESIPQNCRPKENIRPVILNFLLGKYKLPAPDFRRDKEYYAENIVKSVEHLAIALNSKKPMWFARVKVLYCCSSGLYLVTFVIVWRAVDTIAYVELFWFRVEILLNSKANGIHYPLLIRDRLWG